MDNTLMILQEAYKSILEYFDGDTKKTMAWFYTENPGLGMVKPINMIKLGREKKLIKFIKNSLEENRP